jgi:hypothetical protein
MADPNVEVPPVSLASLPEDVRRLLEELVQVIYSAAYTKGTTDTLARIIQAAQPSVHSAGALFTGAGKMEVDASVLHQPPQGQGASSAMIDGILAAAPKGMTPTEIFRSPANEKAKYTLGAVSKVLRRGRNKRYENKKGKWFLKNKTAEQEAA